MERVDSTIFAQPSRASGATLVFNCSGAAVSSPTLWQRGALRSLYWQGAPGGLASSPRPILSHLHIALDNIGAVGGEAHQDQIGEANQDSRTGQGEFLLVKRNQIQRLATFRPIPILGHAQQSYHPWQVTYTYLTSAFDWDDLQRAYGGIDLLQFLGDRAQQMNHLLAETARAPWSSSCSYLCDAVAAAIGFRRRQADYRGQGGLELLNLLTPKIVSSASTNPYPLKIRLLHQQGQPIPYLEPRPMWEQLLEDLQEGEAASSIAGRFYLGLVRGIADMVQMIGETHCINRVSLSGRLLQHPILADRLGESLAEVGPQLTQVA
ncbi:MAG: hypothetical protein ACFB4J_20170 [Elainellaceae cyanobacterium]